MANNMDPRFRPFKVKKKVRESATITSFYLTPVHHADWRPFEAGQFLTIQIPHPGGGEPLIRNYTVSSGPSEVGVYRITVKREAALTSDMANGIASCWLHDAVEEGSVVHIDRPRGAFKLDKASQRPVILLSGGVGLTPTISMLKVLVKESDRPVWFVHACDGGITHALRDEVQALSQERSGVHVHHCYRFPTDEDAKAGLFHSTGQRSSYFWRTTVWILVTGEGSNVGQTCLAARHGNVHTGIIGWEFRNVRIESECIGHWLFSRVE
jgi:ferredoxin-NADP reductase